MIAQDKKDKPKERIPPAFNDLGLTVEQKEDILKIEREYREKIERIEAELIRLKNEQVKKRLAVLTEGQRQKLRDRVKPPEPTKDGK